MREQQVHEISGLSERICLHKESLQAGGQQRTWLDLRRCGHDLRGVDFSAYFGMYGKAVLREAIFDGLNLEGANLAGLDLTRASLKGTNLKNANLADAKLSSANLSGADLTGANLTRAFLTRAKLKGAICKGTLLTGAFLKRANLRRAKYLHESVGLPEAVLAYAKLGTLSVFRLVKAGLLRPVQIKGLESDRASLAAFLGNRRKKANSSQSALRYS